MPRLSPRARSRAMIAVLLFSVSLILALVARADGGRYGRVNWVAIASYVLGILVQVPFIVTTLYTGPVGSALHGVDLSWIIGLVVVTPVYYVGAKRLRFARLRVDRAAGLVSAESAEEVA